MINKIRKLEKIDTSSIVNKEFLIKKDGNIEIYYAPFDYVNSKAKIVIVGITPGLQQMTQSFQVIKDGKSLKEVKDLSSFKGSMRTTLIKYMDELKINKILKIKSCESLFDLDSKYLHTTSLVKYPVFDKGKIIFRDKETTLSGSALLVTNEMGYDWGQVQGAGYWCYQGKTLRELVSEK